MAKTILLNLSQTYSGTTAIVGFAGICFITFLLCRIIADADVHADFRLFYRYDDKRSIHLIKAAAETLGSLQTMHL